MLDTLIHKGRRRQMLDRIAEKHCIEEKVISAMNRVPRHLFIEKGLEHLAYLDKPLPIAAGQTISQPSTVAIQTQLLQLNRWDSVLEIGTGCAYQTAILYEMGYSVYSIERQRELYIEAKKKMVELGYSKPLLFYGDGFKGMPQFAPYKGILITCGAPDIPQDLIRQLAIGGRMVIPVGIDQQEMIVVQKTSEKGCDITNFGAFKFVPMLEGKV